MIQSPFIFLAGFLSTVDSAVLFLTILSFLVGGGLLTGESDWSLLRASLVAVRARAAMFPGELAVEVVEDSFLKNKLPVGRSLVSSFSENAPSLLVDCVGLSTSGGECSFRKNKPNCSFCRSEEKEGGGNYYQLVNYEIV